VFMRNSYFVIFDEVKLARPARVTWLYHVDRDASLVPAKDAVGFDYTMDRVAVTVRQAASPADLEWVDHQDEAWMKNPINGSEMVLTDWKTRHPGGRLMKHNLWVTTRRPVATQTFLTVVYPRRAAQPAPTIEPLDERTVRVTMAGQTEVISFDAATKHPAGVIVKVDQIGAKADGPAW